MDRYTRKDSSHVTNRVSKGTDAEILDPFDQKISPAEAHAMLDCLLDLNLFIQNVWSSLRDLSSQVDDLQRNYTKTTSSIRVGVKDGPSTATPDYDTSIEEIEDACLPEAQVPLTPKTDKDLTASLSPIFNLEKIAIPLRGKQIDTSSEDLPL